MVKIRQLKAKNSWAFSERCVTWPGNFAFLRTLLLSRCSADQQQHQHLLGSTGDTGSQVPLYRFAKADSAF